MPRNTSNSSEPLHPFHNEPEKILRKPSPRPRMSGTSNPSGSGSQPGAGSSSSTPASFQTATTGSDQSGNAAGTSGGQGSSGGITTDSLNATLQAFLTQFTESQNARLQTFKEEILSERNQPDTFEMKRRTALARFSEEHRTAKRQAFLDAGMTPEEATIACNESGEVRPTTIVSQPQQRRYQFKASELGIFHGERDQFTFWANRINRLYHSKSDPAWREPIIDTLPLCLRGAASSWYERQRADLPLETWDQWYNAMKKVFLPDSTDLKHKAESRKWNAKEEDVATYLHDKMTLTLAAYPNHDERDLVIDIKDGLPDGMKALIRTDLARNPTTDDLLHEMGRQEGIYRRMYNAPSAVAIGKRRAVSDESKSTPKQDPPRRRTESNPVASSSGPVSQSRGRQSLRESYSEKNVFFKDGKRWYQVPGSTAAIPLDRNCKTCGKEHFDFEHDALSKSPDIKREAKFVVENYVAYSFDGPDIIDITDDGADAEEPSGSDTDTSDTSTERSPQSKN